MSFMNELLELMPDTVVAQPGYLDGYGGFLTSGDPINLTCRIEGNNKLVRDPDGNEVVSSVQVISSGNNSLTVVGHRYTLPARYSPRTLLRAIDVQKHNDEEGAHHEVIVFP